MKRVVVAVLMSMVLHLSNALAQDVTVNFAVNVQNIYSLLLDETSESEPKAKRILFIGNSFTYQGPVPGVVRELAVSDEKLAPHVEYFDIGDSAGGRSLQWHSTNPATLNAIAKQWDYVVLQEFSTQATQAGNPEMFKQSATALFDLVKASSPAATIFLFETWARHQNHSFYSPPKVFESPEQMQAQVRNHYQDAVNNYIPQNSETGVNNDLFVIPVGDAWEKSYALSNIDLHASDRYHGNQRGQYLSGLLIYSTIYKTEPVGLPSQFTVEDKRGGTRNFTIASAEALQLQQIARDTLNGTDQASDIVQLDFGGSSSDLRWNNIQQTTTTIPGLTTLSGDITGIGFEIIDAFDNVNLQGTQNPQISYPSEVTFDSLYGSNDNALSVFKLTGLEVSTTYALQLFASRMRVSDNRQSLYRVEGASVQTATLNVHNNDSEQVRLIVTPNASGELIISVSAGPNNNNSVAYYYMGALTITPVASAK